MTERMKYSFASWRSAGLGLLLTVLPLLAGAQQAVPPTPFLAVKAVPQYVVQSGYWVEVERGLPRHPRHSITLTPQLYWGPAGRPNLVNYVSADRNESVRGAGLEVRHRYYLRAAKAAYPTGWYVSYGPTFQYFRMAYSTLGWREVKNPDELPHYEYGYIPSATTHISRFGAAAVLGYQAPLPPGRVFLDVYAGLGLRYTHNQSEVVAAQFRSGRSDYGHRGFYFPMGVKVGIVLR